MHYIPVKGVLFDLDDTLFDHQHATAHATSTLHAAIPAFAAWTPEALRGRHADILEVIHVQVLAGQMTIEAARRERFRQLLAEATDAPVPDDVAADLARSYRAAYEAAWRPVPGAAALLAALRAQDLPIGIVTNNLRAEQEQKLQRCGLDGLVDALITSEETGLVKPDPAIFAVALGRMGLTPAEVVMVGDVWATDIAGAMAAGIRPVWLNWRGAPSPDSAVAELRSLEPVHDAAAVIAQCAK